MEFTGDPSFFDEINDMEGEVHDDLYADFLEVLDDFSSDERYAEYLERRWDGSGLTQEDFE